MAGTPKIRHVVHSRAILKEKLCQEDTHRSLPSKKELAKELGISRQSLYYKPKLPEKDLKLKAEIEEVMSNNKAYGHKRIAWALNINKKRALRVMKLFKIPQRDIP